MHAQHYTFSNRTVILKPAFNLVNFVSFNRAAHPEQAFYGGDVKGESAMETVEDIGTAVQHIYLVSFATTVM